MIPKFDQEPLDLDEMNLILRALEWSYGDKNNPDGIRASMKTLHDKLQHHLDVLLDQIS